MAQKTDLCAVCRQIDIEHYLFEKEYLGPVELGGFQSILRRQHCALCRLVIQALSCGPKDKWQLGIYPVETCYLGRLDGSLAAPALDVWFTQTTSTMPKGMYGHNLILGQISPLEIPSDRNRNIQEGVARILESKIDLSIIHGWLNSCLNFHPRCQPDSQHPTGLYLIDVERMRIVESDPSNHYLALSYVWGNVKMLRATKDNWRKLQQDGSLLQLRNQIPQVVNDAIKLVAALNERYLWVDSLCIVQDDRAFTQQQILRMNTTYGHAMLTIVALSGKDANAGLPGIGCGSRDCQQIPETINGLSLIPKLPELSMLKSPWKSRGWAFQERILSLRCIFFAETQVYYQCRSEYLTEDFDGKRFRYAKGLGDHNPFEPIITNPDPTDDSIFGIYESLVKQYSTKELSYPSDSLRAFSGVLSAFSHYFGWRFVSALPQDAWDLAILWRPQSEGIKLRPRHEVCDQSWPWHGVTPTWCWTSWASYINWDCWRLDSYCGKDVSIYSEVEQFFIWEGKDLRTARRPQYNLENGSMERGELEIQKHMSGMSSFEGVRHTDVALHALLVFKAKVFDMSHFSISVDHPWTSRDQKYLAWVYDNNHHHCGTLYGAPIDWPHHQDVSSCEFVVLSRCRQDEVTSKDIEEHRHQLPPEYLSSSDYYGDVFDTSVFKYAEDWAVNVMLIESKLGFSRRIAIGQIHSDALKDAFGYARIVVLT